MKDKILQIIFDCDGVLLQSTQIKTDAFRKTIAQFGVEAQEIFIAYHEKHFGVSRMAKFKWFCEEILKTHNKELPKELAHNFANIMQNEILECPMMPGALETLKKLFNKLPLYVCSGTPQDELVNILTKRNLANYFKGIYGTPPEKSILLQKIIDNNDIDAQNTLMVGDAQTDLDAANNVGTQFYGIGEYFVGRDIPYSVDLFGLYKHIEYR